MGRMMIVALPRSPGYTRVYGETRFCDHSDPEMPNNCDGIAEFEITHYTTKHHAMIVLCRLCLREFLDDGEELYQLADARDVSGWLKGSA